MSIQVIRPNQHTEETIIDKLPVSLEGNVSMYPAIKVIWDTLIDTSADTYQPLRLPRDPHTKDWLNDLRACHRLSNRYDRWMTSLSNLIDAMDEEYGVYPERLCDYIKKHFTSKNYDIFIATIDNVSNIYDILSKSREAYWSHKLMVKWVKQHEDTTDDYHKVLLQLIAKLCILYFDELRLEAHRRYTFGNVIIRKKEIIKEVKQVPEFIKDLLITTMKEQGKNHDCPICMDTIQADDIKFSRCGHLYCEECLLRLIEQGKCAVCRDKL